MINIILKPHNPRVAILTQPHLSLIKNFPVYDRLMRVRRFNHFRRTISLHMFSSKMLCIGKFIASFFDFLPILT